LRCCDEGNAEIRSEVARLLHGGRFDFGPLVGYLHDESRDSQVRWRAGAALAAFSYNSVANQEPAAPLQITLSISTTRKPGPWARPQSDRFLGSSGPTYGSLATFSYNSVANQRLIADCAVATLPPPGGILYDAFRDFLAPSQDDIVRCWAAYQV